MDVVGALEVVQLAEEVDGHARDPDAAAWQARLRGRADDLPMALEVLLAATDHGAALRLVGALGGFFQDTGRVDLGRVMAERALTGADGAGTDRDRARAWLVLGELAFRQGDQTLARDATERALAAADAAGDADVLMGAEFNLARIAFRDGDADRIDHHAQRMLAIAGDDPRSRFGAVHMLGWAAYTAGDIEQAIARFEENVENARTAGHRVGEGSELLNLGSLALEVGDLDRAASHLALGLSVAAELDSSYLLPGALTDTGRLAVLRGRVRAGLALIAAGQRQYEMAWLTPDPGDDAFEQVRADAERRLGPRDAAQAVAAGTAMTRSEAIVRAQAELLQA